jgi:hypothetical protein
VGSVNGAAADRVVGELLTESTTYAEAAGIRLANRPAPLFQLLMLAELLSTRISADIAVAAAREIFAAGLTTPRKVRAAAWPDIVNALGRAHYRRYDESTATRLQRNANLTLDCYRGDLRVLAEDSGHDRDTAARLLQQFAGIGPLGASIFLREVQDVWPWVAPYFDERALRGALRLGLPANQGRLARLCPRGEAARLAAALVAPTLAGHRRGQGGR